MAAVLGLRGTGEFSTDEKPLNWREGILYLYPNGEAPLTGVLSMCESQKTNSYDYNWWEKRLPTQRFTLNGAHGAGVTTLTVNSGAKDTVKGTVLLHETSNELFRVTSDPTDDVTIEVERSYGAVAAGALASADAITVIGNVHAQGSKPPTAKAYAPTKKRNLTEIFRMALYLTRTARRTTLRWDNTGPYREAKREALSLYSIEMEKSFIWGEPIEGTGDNGKPQCMTGGCLNSIVTNKGSFAGGVAGTDATFLVNGVIDEQTFDELMEKVFRYGSSEKLALVGGTFLRAIATLAKRNGHMELVPRTTTYGMKILEYITTSGGSLMLKSHPLFNQHPVWRQNALILDVKNLKSRYIDETMFIKNRQENGEDASLDEYLGEHGFEMHYEETHAYVEGVSGGLVA